MQLSELKKLTMEQLIIVAGRVEFHMREVNNTDDYNDDEVVWLATYKLITDPIMQRVSNFAIYNFPPLKLLIKKNLREYIVYFTNNPTPNISV